MITDALHAMPNRSTARGFWITKSAPAQPRAVQSIAAEKECETVEEADTGLFTRLATYREQRGNVGFTLPFSL
jgi:hypothetical protein